MTVNPEGHQLLNQQDPGAGNAYRILYGEKEVNALSTMVKRMNSHQDLAGGALPRTTGNGTSSDFPEGMSYLVELTTASRI